MALACNLLPLISQAEQLPDVRSMLTFRAARGFQRLGSLHHDFHMVRGAPPVRGKLLFHAARALQVVPVSIARLSSIAEYDAQKVAVTGSADTPPPTHVLCGRLNYLSQTIHAELIIALVVRR